MNYTLKKNNACSVLETLTFNGDDLASFIIEWTSVDEYKAEFIVHEIKSWEMTNNIPIEYNIYLNGSIKFDGSSHIFFGGTDKTISYLYFFDKYSFDKHCNLMQAIYDICKKKIKYFDQEVELYTNSGWKDAEKIFPTIDKEVLGYYELIDSNGAKLKYYVICRVQMVTDFGSRKYATWIDDQSNNVSPKWWMELPASPASPASPI